MVRISGARSLMVIACSLTLLLGCAPQWTTPESGRTATMRGATISGSVFRDLDGDGAWDPREQGEPGVKVAAYDADGRLVATSTTGLAGDYVLNAELDPAQIVAGQTYRVEFSGWAEPLQPGSQGLDSGTELQFVAGGADDVSFGLFNPDQYSVRKQVDPSTGGGATPGAGEAGAAPGKEAEGTPAVEVTAAYDGPFAGSVPAPDFPAGLEWLNTGRPLSYADLRGKVVLLEFWTFGCIACVELIPQLKGLQERYPDELVIIGVHAAKFPHEGQTENIRHFVQRHDIDYPVVNDSEYQVAGDYQASIWPTLVLVNPLGRYIGARTGRGASDQIEASIGELVAAFDQQGLIDRTPLDLDLERESLVASPLRFPSDVVADAARDRLFIADAGHNRVVVADLSGRVEAVIGSGEPGLRDGDYQTASFHHPQGMALAGDGTLYVADTENHALRRVDLVQNTVETVVGEGRQQTMVGERTIGGEAAELNYLGDVLYQEGIVYITLAGQHQIWTYDPGREVAQVFAGSGQEALTDGPLPRAAFNQPSALATDGRVLYVADSEASAIREIDLDPGGGVRTLAGQGFFIFGDVDGRGDAVRLQRPGGVDYQDGVLYVADSYNNKIKVMDPETSEVRTLLGTGETGWRDGAEALFSEPGGLDTAGNRLYVADTNNHVVRVIDLERKTASTLILVDEQGLLAGHGPGEAPDGEAIRLPPQNVAPGQGEIRLDVKLPAGYKVNDLAPALFRWWGAGEVVELVSGQPERTVVKPVFPLAFEARFREGRGELGGEAVVYYCRTGAEARCFVEEVQFVVPVTVTGEVAGGTILVEHVVDVP